MICERTAQSFVLEFTVIAIVTQRHRQTKQRLTTKKRFVYVNGTAFGMHAFHVRATFQTHKFRPTGDVRLSYSIPSTCSCLSSDRKTVALN